MEKVDCKSNTLWKKWGMQHKQDCKPFKAKTVPRKLLAFFVLNKVQMNNNNNLLQWNLNTLDWIVLPHKLSYLF